MITKVLCFIGFHKNSHVIHCGRSVTARVCDDCGRGIYEENF